MKEFARNLLPAAIPAGLCSGAAMAADLSTVGQWTNKYTFDKIAGGKSRWDQPGVQVASGKRNMSKKKLMFSEQHYAHSGPLRSFGKIPGGHRRRLDGLTRCRKASPA